MSADERPSEPIRHASANDHGVHRARQGFESNPLVRRIPAISSGAYVTPDVQTITQLRFQSVLGTPWALDELRPGLEKAAG
ncbi:hypothetical protein [Saccharopolyspora mangrovi]|uniref:Uncharacterized protein n=1 Tax=Saccharopolyspora mangrovi TaxID=3082379 RepID=A0ABU6A8B7_9PSEU|nr:hypothetical protein [Saccharopolyspora sp. S2-29]MEB3367620.1 hypothetical protein [Saccharopolyspora sp. S2-29]